MKKQKDFTLWLVLGIIAVAMLASACEKEKHEPNCLIIGEQLDVETGTYKYAYEFEGQRMAAKHPSGEIEYWRNKSTVYTNTFYVKGENVCDGFLRTDSIPKK